MKYNLIFLTGLALLATACGEVKNTADKRQALATAAAMDAADREIGMPRIANYTQRKLLKNSYEDMDQTVLTYVYVQALDGKFVCLGQSLGYGVMGGTQFTAPHRPDYLAQSGVYEQPQPEPNGLFTPESGAATIVNLIDPATGEARTALIEMDVVTVPFKLPTSVVNVACPGDIDPTKLKDVQEKGVLTLRK